jgi:hypothetical protein
MLLYDGLHCFGQRSICRLRVLRMDGAPRVVIATHLEDSPGASITNDFEALVASVSAGFGEEPTRWLLHYPQPDGKPGLMSLAWTEGIPGPDVCEWRRLDRTEAEAISGLDLSNAEIEPATVIALAGESDLLRELAQTPEPERLPGEHLQAVPVSALPFPHGPFRCPHKQRFSEIGRFYEDASGTVVGAHWYLTLTSDDFAACSFHACDWLRVANASVDVLESLSADATYDDLIAACSAQGLPKAEAEGLHSLFAHPIDWTPGSPTLTNGQHRSCALRAAGAERCVVDTAGYWTDESDSASAEAAASASLASYWAHRAAEG